MANIAHIAQEAESLIDFEFACMLCLLVAACCEIHQMRSNYDFFIFIFLVSVEVFCKFAESGETRNS